MKRDKPVDTPEANDVAEGTCPECGAAVDENDFCPGCGAPLATVICPSCYEENPPRTDFCRSCNRPLEYISFIDPIRGIEAGGWVLREISRKADEQQINKLLVWGAVLAFGPYLLYIVCLILTNILRVANHGMSVVSDLTLLLWIIAPIGYSILLFKVLASRRRHAPEQDSPAVDPPVPGAEQKNDPKAP
jgi:hypothetical protein